MKKINFDEMFDNFIQSLEEEKQEPLTEEEKTKIRQNVRAATHYTLKIVDEMHKADMGTEEKIILKYLIDDMPENNMPEVEGLKDSAVYTVSVLVLIKFVHAHKDIAMILTDDAERKQFIKNINPDELKVLGIDPENKRVKALLESENPSLDEVMKIIGFPNAVLLQTANNQYRTRAKAAAAETIAEKPDHLAITTLKDYQYALSLYQQGGAHLQPLKSTDGLKFTDGKLYFDALEQPELEAELKNNITKENIQNIDLATLRIFYSIILTEFEKSNRTELKPVISMYVPDLAEFIGLPRNLNKKEVLRVLEKTQSYHNIVGVIHGTRNGKPVESYYQVLNFHSYNDKTNTITFSSPYMNYVIKTVANIAIRKNSNGKKQLKRDGTPLTLPTHSYLIDSSIVKERNKAAVENVIILVTLIEQAGNNIPRIKASTLIERNVQFSERLEHDPQHKAQLLKRVFSKTWELLRTKTRLQEVYKNIRLPDPNDPAYIPTVKGLEDMVIEIKHEGKK